MYHVPQHPFVISPILIPPTCSTCYVTEKDGECDADLYSADEPLDCDPLDHTREFMVERLAADYSTIGDLVRAAAVVYDRVVQDINTESGDDSIPWRVSRHGRQQWLYHYYDIQTRQYRLLYPGDTAPSSSIMVVLCGMQDLVLETMPDVLVFPADGLPDLMDCRSIRKWTGRDMPEAQELIGHRLIDYEDDQGCYFDLTDYFHLAYYEDSDPNAVFHEYDIYVRMPSSNKSARSAR